VRGPVVRAYKLYGAGDADFPRTDPLPPSLSSSVHRALERVSLAFAAERERLSRAGISKAS